MSNKNKNVKYKRQQQVRKARPQTKKHDKNKKIAIITTIIIKKKRKNKAKKKVIKDKCIISQRIRIE